MHLKVTESRPAIISLAEGEPELLESIGKALASSRVWWRQPQQEEQGSVVGLERLNNARFRVTFRDVVGVVNLGARQIHVEPKIPLTHFTYLARHADLAPRVSTAPVLVSDGNGFVELLAQWCVGAAEVLLRRGLRTDYQSRLEESDAVRGSLRAPETALQNLCGRPVAICELDELTQDASLNRIVRAACERLTLLAAISDATRLRARRICFRMDGIGPLQTQDLRVTVDRVTASYSSVLPLALLVLGGCGIDAAHGGKVGSAFLVRTPELVEDGLRNVLVNGLSALSISKRRKYLGDSGLSMNPDLVFGSTVAVGDVKYRYLKQDWNRSDLNQIVAFATAFETGKAGSFGFVSSDTASTPCAVPVGTVRVSSFAWNAAPHADPAMSARQLCERVADWLKP